MGIVTHTNSATAGQSNRLVLVTGATGLIGSHLLARLATRDAGAYFVALTRRPEAVAGFDGRVHALAGDLREPGFGVDTAVMRKLQERLTEIIHCAAEIRFDLPLEEARQTNVEGTRTLLEIARGCGRLRKFAHVSTTYVCGQSPDALPEGAFTNRHGFFSSYQESKYEAEQLAMAAAGELPLAIYRLSTVIGDSRSGAVEQYNHFHQLLRLVQHNPLPILPGCTMAQADFVATDWVAAGLAWMFENRFEAGSICNFAAGPEDTVPLPVLLRMAFERLGRGRTPELVSWEEFERYTQTRLRRGEARVGQLLQALTYFLPYFSLRQRFENARTMAELERAGIERVGSRELFSRVLDYMGRENGAARSARRAVPAGEPVR